MSRVTGRQNREIETHGMDLVPIKTDRNVLLERTTADMAQCRNTLEWILNHDDEHGFLPSIYRQKIDAVLSAFKRNALRLPIEEDDMAYEFDMAIFFDTTTKAVTVSFRGKIVYLPGPYADRKTATLAGEAHCHKFGWQGV